jgi:hypothetical protein
MPLPSRERTWKAPVVLTIGAFLMCLSCKNDIELVQEVGQENIWPFQTVYSGEYVFTDSALVRNVLRAGKLEQFANDTNYVQVSDGVELDIYNRSENIAARLISLRGLFIEGEGRMEAFDDVIFSNPKGDSLFTQHLIWFSDSGLVITPGEVRILRSDGLEIEGTGLRAKDDFSRYTILEPKGDIAIPDESR